jgi:hypothetical protein
MGIVKDAKDPNKTTEADLGRGLAQWLTGDRWEVFQEVQLSSYGKRADIVARRAGCLWVIECKQTLTLAVMEQATAWRGWAHHVSIATWQAQRGSGDGRMFAREVCEWKGIGLITMSKPNNVGVSYWPNVNEVVHPRLWRVNGHIHPPHKMLDDRLCEEHKTFAQAGNNRSQYWSPFQQTCRLLTEVVQREPGITMKDAMAKIRHHYSDDKSARSSIGKWMEQGATALEGIEARREGKSIKLYPAAKKPPDNIASRILDD